MIFSEFIERYKAMDSLVIPDLEFTKYITIGEKVEIAQRIVNSVNEQCGEDTQAPSFIKTKEVFKFFALFISYTDIEISFDEMTEENYDYCQMMGIERLLISNIPIYEYRKFEKIIDDMIQVTDVLLLKNAIVTPDYMNLNSERAGLTQDLTENSELIGKLFDIISPQKRG